MTWTPKNCESFSVCMHENNGTQSVVFDITPSRWTTRIPLEDAILSLATKCMLYYEYDNKKWNFSSDIRSGPTPYTHPDYDYSPCAINIHNGTPLIHKVILTYEGGDLVLPDGTRKNLTHFAKSNTTFFKNGRSGSEYKHMIFELSRKLDTQNHQGIRSTLCAAALGAAHAFGENGMSEMICKHDDDVKSYIARTVSLLTKSFTNCKWAGADATLKGREPGNVLANTLIEAWILRPDSAWYGTRWILDEKEMRELKEKVQDTLAFEAGYEMMKKAIEIKATNDTLGFIASSNTPAHYKMMCKKHQKDVEDAGLMVFSKSPERLKTRAKGRAMKLVNSL